MYSAFVLLCLLGESSSPHDLVGPEKDHFLVNARVNNSIISSTETKPDKPVLTYFTADWCTYCKWAGPDLEAAAKKGELPFRLNVVKEKDFPAWMVGKSLPRFYWPAANGDWKQVSGWPVKGSCAALVNAWKLTQVTPSVSVPPKQIKSEPEVSRYTRKYPGSYWYPENNGDLRTHLIQEHGNGQNFDGWTYQEMLDFHSDQHNAPGAVNNVKGSRHAGRRRRGG